MVVMTAMATTTVTAATTELFATAVALVTAIVVPATDVNTFNATTVVAAAVAFAASVIVATGCSLYLIVVFLHTSQSPLQPLSCGRVPQQVPQKKDFSQDFLPKAQRSLAMVTIKVKTDQKYQFSMQL